MPGTHIRLAEVRADARVPWEAPPVEYSKTLKELEAQKRVLRRKQARRAALVCYIISVAAGTFGWSYWGCFCHDPDHGNPNPWNTLDGVNIHECSDLLAVGRLVGVGWCCALGGGVAAHLYVTIPVLLWIAKYYGKKFALRTLVQGMAVGGALAAVLHLLIDGFDPPPGFGISGSPLGASVFAGLCAWLVFSLGAGAGFWRNRNLGGTMRFVISYLVLAGCAGIVVSFRVHVWLGPAVTANLMFMLGWATQVKLTTESRRKALLAYVAPALIGAGLGVPIEIIPGRFGLPPVGGAAIGMAALFLSICLLTWAYERRGPRYAFYFCIFLLFQDGVGIAAATAGYQLSILAGLLVALALEGVIATAIIVGAKEGTQYAVISVLFNLTILCSFAPLLTAVFGLEVGLAFAVAAGSAFGSAVVVTASFMRWGGVAGLRAMFLIWLIFAHFNLFFVELVVVEMDSMMAIVFGAASFAFLLGALVLGLRADDGSGRLYGSGVEVHLFVCICQGVAYGTGLLMYLTLKVADLNAHLSAAAIGGVLLVCPNLARRLAGKANGPRNFKRGLWVAILLMVLWFLQVILLHVACDLDADLSVGMSLVSTLAFVVIMMCAIWRFICTLLLDYLIALSITTASLIAIYMSDLPVPPLVIICIISAIGFLGPTLLMYPLAMQRATVREEAGLNRQAKALLGAQAVIDAIKAAKPTDPYRKHRKKTLRLAKARGQGKLPRLLDLTHNGVMERAGLAGWCVASVKDGRPMLPMTPQLLVCKGSFLYVFSPEGDERLPTSRALDAVPLYSAQATCIPSYIDERLPDLANLVAVELTLPWRGRSRIYLQFDSPAMMGAWEKDINQRANETSSRSSLRQNLYDVATEPDPSLACGMIAAKKAMARAVTESERVAAAAAVGRSEMYARSKRIATAKAPGTREKLTRIQMVAARKEKKAAEARPDVFATQLVSTGGNVVVYTPRAHSGTWEDMTKKAHQTVPMRYPGLAASARDAAQRNEQERVERQKRRSEWLTGGKLGDGDGGDGEGRHALLLAGSTRSDD